MKIRILLFVSGLVALAGVVRAQDGSNSLSDLNELKEYFNVEEGLSSEDHRERFKDFIVTPESPQVSDTTEYKLEFSVTSETFFKIVDGYLVFQFPEGFGLSELDAADIWTDFRYIFLYESGIETDGRFVIITYAVVVIDTAWDSTVVPERVNFDIRLHQIVNPSRTRNYKISGAAITDHRFVAGPTWSESFEITEESQETKAELKIISTEMIAPNSPKVNTNQEVSIEVLVANVSKKTAHDVSVGMSSDGESNINSPNTIEVLEPNDTAAVLFEVTAASESGTENFTSNILSGNVIEIEAVDDTAGMIIQTPAMLVLTSSVSDGDTLYFEAGEIFRLEFLLQNNGEAEVDSGRYQLTRWSDNPDDLPTVRSIGFIKVGVTVSFEITSSTISTLTYWDFRVSEIPREFNTNALAQMEDRNIAFTTVSDFSGKGLAETFIVENNPFNPNNGPVTFVYNLSGASDVEFNIFTVTGEEVYSHTYLSGSEGGKSGTNQIQWDGRNSEGEMVLNGVYVTMLNVHSTGEKASLKLAVLK